MQRAAAKIQHNKGGYGPEQTQQHNSKMYNKVCTIVTLQKAWFRGTQGSHKPLQKHACACCRSQIQQSVPSAVANKSAEALLV
jgi:hypothetical protein